MNRAKASPSPSPLTPLLWAGVLFLLVLLAMAGVRSYRDLAATKEREALLDARIEETEERVESLKRRIERLRNDPVTLERMARQELGMVRPGDVVIVLPEDVEDF